MDSSQTKPNCTFSVFRLLNIGSVALWFLYAKSTIGTLVFPYLLAFHVCATWGFAYVWYRHDKRAGLTIIMVIIMIILSVAWFFLYERP